MKTSVIPAITCDEYQDFVRHIKQQSIEDKAHCGWCYLQGRKMVCFWCDMSPQTKMGKPCIMVRKIYEDEVPNKLLCHWLLDSFLSEWKANACSLCDSCERFREKLCDCMQNKFVRRMANSILRSFGKNKVE